MMNRLIRIIDIPRTYRSVHVCIWYRSNSFDFRYVRLKHELSIEKRIKAKFFFTSNRLISACIFSIFSSIVMICWVTSCSSPNFGFSWKTCFILIKPSLEKSKSIVNKQNLTFESHRAFCFFSSSFLQLRICSWNFLKRWAGGRLLYGVLIVAMFILIDLKINQLNYEKENKFFNLLSSYSNFRKSFELYSLLHRLFFSNLTLMFDYY